MKSVIGVSGIFAKTVFENCMKKLIVVVFFLIFINSLKAHEGMWVPILLNVSDMQSNGMRLTQEDIFSIKQSSLKDAIVHFGGGCTAEVISNQGLILTNHHCGYSAIQSHSSVSNDYLKDGFWAASTNDELPCAGLTATFIVNIEDVTALILEGVNDETPLSERYRLVAERSVNVAKEAVKDTHFKANVKSFYYGNQFLLITTEEFLDVRLVGAPPSAIGKFGGDTDNWVWPRHTGDFSLFRIYSSSENTPSKYSENNVPMVPKKSLSISTKGVQEGDFTMVYGFPGTTTQYLISDAVDYIINKSNPAKIEMRNRSLGIIDAAMLQSDEMRIKYASKQSNISNAYKKWIGENMGLIRYDALSKKIAFENDFNEAVAKSDNKLYVDILPSLKTLQSQIEPLQDARNYFVEFVIYGPEILKFTRRFEELAGNYDELSQKGTLEKKLADLKRASERHFKDYDFETDRKLFVELLKMYLEETDAAWQPAQLKFMVSKYKGDVEKLGNELYAKSVFAVEQKLSAVLESGNAKRIKKLSDDMAFQLMVSFYNHFANEIRPAHELLSVQTEDWMRLYVKAQMELFPEKSYWSDANSTMRVSYGKVEGCIPQDGMVYTYQTTIEGINQKHVPGHVDFDAPERLLELYRQKDFGDYGVNGTLPVAFLASNHTTGGNSGSPVLNADGHLIGLNFDRSWQSTMSDVMFNPEICRNISVDIRYVLFVIDKYAGAGHLIEEMNLIN
jgi:hypothetical protein